MNEYTISLYIVLPWWGWFGIIVAILGAGIWIGKVQTNQRSFKEFMEEIRRDIKKIFERLPPAVYSTGSPIRLTELGERIASEIDAKSWAREQVSKLLPKAKHLQPFEIQKLASSYTKEFNFDKNARNAFEMCAYENGVDLDSVHRVLEIVSTDQLLKASNDAM